MLRQAERISGAIDGRSNGLKRFGTQLGVSLGDSEKSSLGEYPIYYCPKNTGVDRALAEPVYWCCNVSFKTPSTAIGTHMPQTKQKTLERSALIVATLTSFMGPFMISSDNVALPAIQADLGLDAVQLSWIATAYLLAVAGGLGLAGKVADIHGRKKVFTFGLAVYTVGSFLAGFSGSAGMLIGLRVVQGLGAAMFVTTGMAILTSIFPPERRGRVIGIYVAAVYIGLSVGLDYPIG